jgi:acetyl-CoA carboxylase biotin carboxyl carrier protein
MDQRELKKLVQLMNDNGLIELEIEREGERLHLRKAEPPGTTPPLVHMSGMPMSGGAMMPMAGQMPVATPPADAAEVEAAPDPSLKEIRSPMVGTFYRRPSPESDAYVEVGTSVDDETIVCIVEAMKVNNEIKAEIEGEIVEVLVEDGQPVEYDQPLFLVKS